MSALTRSLALVTALFAAALPLGCAEEDDTEVLEFGELYSTDMEKFTYTIDGDANGLVIDQPFTLSAEFFAPTPDPGQSPLDVEIHVAEPYMDDDGGVEGALPTIERSAVNKFQLKFTLTAAGRWIVPVTVTDANGISDTCYWKFPITARY